MTDLMSIKNGLSALKPELQQRFFVNSIGLFGSVVRNDFTASSDIDIIVDFTKTVGIEFVDLANFIESKLNRKIDLVSKKRREKKIFRTNSLSNHLCLNDSKTVDAAVVPADE